MTLLTSLTALANPPQTGLLPVADQATPTEIRVDLVGPGPLADHGVVLQPDTAVSARGRWGPGVAGFAVTRPIACGQTVFTGTAQVAVVDRARFTLAPWVFTSILEPDARTPSWCDTWLGALDRPPEVQLDVGATLAWRGPGWRIAVNAVLPRPADLSTLDPARVVGPFAPLAAELHLDVHLTELAARPNPRATDTVRLSARRLAGWPSAIDAPIRDLQEPGVDLAYRHERASGCFVEGRASGVRSGPRAGIAVGFAG